MIRFIICFALVFSCVASVPHAEDTRFFYLSPVDGTGTDADPFHSRCLRLPGGANIDLRPDETVSTGKMLCASASLPTNMVGVLLLANGFTATISPAQKALLRVALGVTNVDELTAETFDAILPQLLIDLPTAKAGLWKPLRAGRDGKYKIFLGGQTPAMQTTAWYYDRYHESDGGLRADILNGAIAVAGFIEDFLLKPVTAWATTLATETFPTNGNLNGSTQVHAWTEFFGTAITVSGNVVIATGASTNEARLDADLATDDMEVQATITAATAANEIRCGVIGRKDSSTTRTYYTAHATFDLTPSVSEWRLGKRVAGTSTVFGVNTTDPAVNDVVRLRSDGSEQSLYVNDVEFVAPVTDTAITTNTRVGLFFAGNDASDTCSLDNLVAYDYPLPASSVGHLRRRSL